MQKNGGCRAIPNLLSVDRGGVDVVGEISARTTDLREHAVCYCQRQFLRALWHPLGI